MEEKLSPMFGFPDVLSIDDRQFLVQLIQEKQEMLVYLKKKEDVTLFEVGKIVKLSIMDIKTRDYEILNYSVSKSIIHNGFIINLSIKPLDTKEKHNTVSIQAGNIENIHTGIGDIISKVSLEDFVKRISETKDYESKNRLKKLLNSEVARTILGKSVDILIALLTK